MLAKSNCPIANKSTEAAAALTMISTTACDEGHSPAKPEKMPSEICEECEVAKSTHSCEDCAMAYCLPCCKEVHEVTAIIQLAHHYCAGALSK